MNYDVIIIGGGPAGVTAGIYIKRAGYTVLIFTNESSSLNKTEKIENYYGFESPVDGKKLYKTGINQANKLGIKTLYKEVIGIKYADDNEYEIAIANQGTDETYKAKYIIIATGVNRNKPKINEIEKYEGRGVSYCAICDAPFYKGKKVAVLGSGEYAISEIQELLPVAQNVIMLTNGKKAPEQRADINVNEKEIIAIDGDKKLQEVEFKDGTRIKIDGLFIAQGTASSVDFAKKIGAQIENNAIKVNTDMQTTVKGIYACGDCTGGILQISKSIYEGMKAGLSVINKLRLE